jgi:GDP-L-fucose synthase|tara:strand:- start:136 stop:1101 length:966 start_codon:yes stop_codon:yes gene_type:complete
MFYKDKKVVVTGGSGFVGTNFLLELLERGADVTTHTHVRPMEIQDERIKIAKDIDLFKLDDCMKLLDGADYVIHCGGYITNPSEVRTNVQVLLHNINSTANVLEASAKCGLKGYLDINSSTGYPDKRYPITEDEYWDEEPHEAYFGYGWMRRYREKLMEFVSGFSDLKIALGRGTAMYGPYDNFNPKTCHVIPALIHRVLSGEDPFVVWGTPDVVRDFLYVRDVVDGGLLVLEKGESMKPYNIGAGTAITVGDIVESILKATDKNPKIVYDETKPTTIPFRMVSTDRIQNELGFKSKWTFEEGIQKTVNWYLENRNDSRRN